VVFHQRHLLLGLRLLNRQCGLRIYSHFSHQYHHLFAQLHRLGRLGKRKCGGNCGTRCSTVGAEHRLARAFGSTRGVGLDVE
jgi:hypothetical protein